MMKKVLLIPVLVSLLFINIKAQEVISTSGGYFEKTNGSLSWTLGESITETYNNGTNILTQGFQQSKITAVSVFELNNTDITITIAPNPTTDFINLYINDYKNIRYQLFDFNGKTLKKANIYSDNTKISFSELSYAAYFLKIMKGNKMIKTYQIIKQK